MIILKNWVWTHLHLLYWGMVTGPVICFGPRSNFVWVLYLVGTDLLREAAHPSCDLHLEKRIYTNVP